MCSLRSHSIELMGGVLGIHCNVNHVNSEKEAPSPTPVSASPVQNSLKRDVDS